MGKVITINRQFGSGGREVAKRLADELHIPYYDKEILSKIAEKSELSAEYIGSIIEQKGAFEVALTYSNTFISTKYYSPMETMQKAQVEVMEQLAEAGDCIIVGRGSNHILADKAFKVFIYSSDMDARIARCYAKVPADQGKMSKEAMIKHIKKVDKKREKYNKIFSDEKWLCMSGYNLCIDTAKIDIKTAVKLIAEAIK